MRSELETKLITDFPALYGPASQSDEPFEFECDDGWYDLIYRLSSAITKIVEAHEKPDQFGVFQVKEKFGTLKFYLSRYTDEMHDIIGKAEEESGKICETCGKEGTLRTDGWVRTICDPCEARRQERWRQAGRRDSGASDSD